uniref:Uncharacterized protein n=1 Tax=Strombidium inclinatum TaxID=197538 RepID=A0A7S3INJ5_9SPIT
MLGRVQVQNDKPRQVDEDALRFGSRAQANLLPEHLCVERSCFFLDVMQDKVEFLLDGVWDEGLNQLVRGQVLLLAVLQNVSKASASVVRLQLIGDGPKLWEVANSGEDSEHFPTKLEAHLLILTPDLAANLDLRISDLAMRAMVELARKPQHFEENETWEVVHIKQLPRGRLLLQQPGIGLADFLEEDFGEAPEQGE